MVQYLGIPACCCAGAAAAALGLGLGATASAQEGPSFEVYGFAQLDYVQDFKRVNPDWDATLRPSKIPTIDGLYGDDGQSVISVRQSRLGVRARQPIAGDDLFVRFEFDLYGVVPPEVRDHAWSGFSDFKRSFGGRQLDYSGTWELPVKRLSYALYRLARGVAG